MDEDIIESDISSMVADIVEFKIKIALLKRKKRLLLEELYVQYLEGESEPRKKIKRTKHAAGEHPNKKNKSTKSASSNLVDDIIRKNDSQKSNDIIGGDITDVFEDDKVDEQDIIDENIEDDDILDDEI